MPDFAELSNLENWVHFNPYILKLGRSTYYVDPKVPEEQRRNFLASWASQTPRYKDSKQSIKIRVNHTLLRLIEIRA